MSAYPILHLLAYGTGGQRFNRSELAVEAADALERLNRRCDGCKHGENAELTAQPSTWCNRIALYFKSDHFCALWEPQPLTPAHDKEKS